MRFCLWITGLPGSGKSTIVAEVVKMMRGEGLNVLTLNLDSIRKILTPEPRYTDEERDIVYRSLVYMGKLMFEESDKNIIIDATGNRIKYRNLARELISEFAEVFVKCPLEVCRKREAARDQGNVEQNLYQKAGRNQLKGELPGVTVPYEVNKEPELEIDSDILAPRESAERIMNYVRVRWL